MEESLVDDGLIYDKPRLMQLRELELQFGTGAPEEMLSLNTATHKVLLMFCAGPPPAFLLEKKPRPPTGASAGGKQRKREEDVGSTAVNNDSKPGAKARKEDGDDEEEELAPYATPPQAGTAHVPPHKGVPPKTTAAEFRAQSPGAQAPVADSGRPPPPMSAPPPPPPPSDRPEDVCSLAVPPPSKPPPKSKPVLTIRPSDCDWGSAPDIAAVPSSAPSPMQMTPLMQMAPQMQTAPVLLPLDHLFHSEISQAPFTPPRSADDEDNGVGSELVPGWDTGERWNEWSRKPSTKDSLRSPIGIMLEDSEDDDDGGDPASRKKKRRARKSRNKKKQEEEAMNPLPQQGKLGGLPPTGATLLPPSASTNLLVAGPHTLGPTVPRVVPPPSQPPLQPPPQAPPAQPPNEQHGDGYPSAPRFDRPPPRKAPVAPSQGIGMEGPPSPPGKKPTPKGQPAWGVMNPAQSNTAWNHWGGAADEERQLNEAMRQSLESSPPPKPPPSQHGAMPSRKRTAAEVDPNALQTVMAVIPNVSAQRAQEVLMSHSTVERAIEYLLDNPSPPMKPAASPSLRRSASPRGPTPQNRSQGTSSWGSPGGGRGNVQHSWY